MKPTSLDCDPINNDLLSGGFARTGDGSDGLSTCSDFISGFKCGDCIRQVSPSFDETRRVLLKLLSEVAGPCSRTDTSGSEVGTQIDLCFTRVKAEASEDAALVDASALHGRALLTQAQKRLENLQALKVLESVASESFRMLKGTSSTH